MRLALVILLCVSLPAFGGKKKQPPVKTAPAAAAPPPELKEPQDKVTEAFGDKVVALLKGMETATAWRVSDPGQRPDPAKAIGSDFQREAKGKDLSADDLKRLRQVLYDEKSFRLTTVQNNCNFSPDIAFDGQAGIDSLQILVSFKCNTMMFFTTKPGGRSVPGTSVDFKPSHKQLLTLAKELLPQDSPTQSLK
jgi:hypothetical protein